MLEFRGVWSKDDPFGTMDIAESVRVMPIALRYGILDGSFYHKHRQHRDTAQAPHSRGATQTLGN